MSNDEDQAIYQIEEITPLEAENESLKAELHKLKYQCCVENCTGEAQYTCFIMAGIRLNVCERHRNMYRNYWRAERQIAEKGQS